MQWYNKTSEEVFTELHSSNQGLSTEVAVQKLQEHGKNELKQESKTPFTQKLLAQLLDPMIIILVLASVVSAVVGEVIDALIIIAIVLINTALSLYQEGKAEAAIEALQKMSSPKAKMSEMAKELKLILQN